jgi:hypothetical protein
VIFRCLFYSSEAPMNRQEHNQKYKTHSHRTQNSSDKEKALAKFKT